MKLLTHLTAKERIESYSISVAGRSSFKCASNRITVGDVPEQNIRLCLVPAHLASLTSSFSLYQLFFRLKFAKFAKNCRKASLSVSPKGGVSFYLMITFTEMSYKHQRFCPLDPFLLSFVPSAPSLGHFPCKPASSGARPGAEGQSCRWDTLDMGDTQQIYFSTANKGGAKADCQRSGCAL